jgi:hypothetical protein
VSKTDQNHIIVSGANITFGGPLQIFKDVLNYLSLNQPDKKIVAIVNSSALFPPYKNVYFIEVKKYKQFILLKFYYEYFRFYYISTKYNPILWLSLNDCTPTVKAKVRAVLCHNASPFYPRELRDFLHPTIIFMQSIYYELFYRINIRKNKFVIVQQQWFREYFVKKFHVLRSRIIINHINDNHIDVNNTFVNTSNSKLYTFIYPTKAARYKNIEVICKAVAILNKLSISNYKVIITIDGTENNFSKKLLKKYEYLKTISWVGTLSREELDNYYSESNCLLFPSKLETWGLPISEFKKYNRPILFANLPYATETIGKFKYGKSFDPDSYKELATLMQALVSGVNISFDILNLNEMQEPYTKGWSELFDLLLNA